jgi:hypothetical protein
MTPEEIDVLKHGKFVVVDLDVAPRKVSLVTYTSGSSGGRRFGIVRFKSAAAASEFIWNSASQGVVVGRHTSAEAAGKHMSELQRLASESFQKRNRFLELWVAEDGTVKYRQQKGALDDWKAVLPDDRTEFAVALRIVARGALRELGVPLSA